MIEPKLRWPAALICICLIGALLAAFVAYRIETWPARTASQAKEGLVDIARRVRDAIVEIAQLQPKIVVNGRVFFEQTTPILELAVLKRQTQVERETMHTWAGSTKRIKLR